MKRIISFVLALTMILTFCACGTPGKLKPYLNGLQLGADATDMRKIASSLNEAGTINVNGIDFDLVYTEYLNGLSYIEYLTDKTLLLAHATTNSDHPTPQFEFDQESIVEADEIASNFLDQYNNAYEILVNSFGEPTSETKADHLLTSEALVNKSTRESASAYWFYQGYNIQLDVQSSLHTFQADSTIGFVIWSYEILTQLKLTITKST